MTERDIALQHRMSPMTGAVLGLGLGAVAGGLAMQSKLGAGLGAVLGGLAGYLVLSQKLDDADPPPEVLPSSEVTTRPALETRTPGDASSFVESTYVADKLADGAALPRRRPRKLGTIAPF